MINKIHLLISCGIFCASIIGSIVHTILNRRRIKNCLANRSGNLIPSNLRIYGNRNKLVLIGLGLGLFGLHSVLFVRINVPYTIATSLMLAIGIFILILIILKIAPVGWLQFSDVGISIGLRKGQYTIPWNAIEDWRIAELAGNISVFINLQHPVIDSSWIDSRDPLYLPRIQKLFSQNFTLFGAQVLIVLEIWNISPVDIIYTIRERVDWARSIIARTLTDKSGTSQ